MVRFGFTIFLNFNSCSVWISVLFDQPFPTLSSLNCLETACLWWSRSRCSSGVKSVDHSELAQTLGSGGLKVSTQSARGMWVPGTVSRDKLCGSPTWAEAFLPLYLPSVSTRGYPAYVLRLQPYSNYLLYFHTLLLLLCAQGIPLAAALLFAFEPIMTIMFVHMTTRQFYSFFVCSFNNPQTKLLRYLS